ncbi:MAG TPA: hypothetical protein VLF40_00370 [Candidatus Saccharimonadales bacterium]|nr:hypothetical protein [Candidatus Saccharimonadales bacterium]
MSKQTIAVDIDEVLSPLHDVVLTHHNQVYGTDFPVDDTEARYFLSDYTHDSDDVIKAKLMHFVDSEAFKNIKPFDEAIKILTQLSEHFDIIVITARQDFYEAATKAWLQQHFPDVFRSIHFTDYSVGTVLKIPKAQVCKDNGASYIIDDSLKTIRDCAEAGLGAILFGDYPWNQADELPSGVTRCKDWPAVLEFFERRQG